ncbi:MAG TPA: CGNR zinc finger domain-containing protein [Gemmatimonadales bacterium]|jgi:predicted RNA-binding Zn ribbon-like protein|nr:CGNR zinc finger domain-containing protein [Gemmatimonadales bacterium]
MSKTASPLDGIICIDFVNGSGPGQPAEAPSVRRLRTLLTRILRAEAAGTGAAETDLAALNRLLARAGANRGIRPAVRGYGWDWIDPADGEMVALWSPAFSAARLLAGPDLFRLSACGECGRLYLDRSPNRSRRWCDMAACGTRAKVRRHRDRIRAASRSGPPHLKAE